MEVKLLVRFPKRQTTFLHGEDAGSKLTKAQSLGVQVITEAQFQEMISNKEE